MNYDDLIGNLTETAIDDITISEYRRKLILSAVAAIQELQRDAMRYRWLREQQYNDDVDLKFMDYNEEGPTDTWYSLWGAQLDAAIDEAMQRETR